MITKMHAPLALLLLIALSIISISPSVSDEVPSIALVISSERCTTDGVKLRMEITNNGSATLDVERAFLPWGAQDSLLLVVVSNDDESKVIERTRFLIHHAPEVIRISPGKKVSGVLDLRREFPTLLNELAKRDLIVFWSYEMENAGGARSERLAGSIGLRHIGSGSQDCGVF